MAERNVTRRILLRTGSAGLAAPVLLAACGGEEDLDELPQTGVSEGKVVYGTWGTPERRELENWSLLAFQKNYSDLRVDVVWAPTAREYLAKLHSLLSSGTPPDVMRLPSWSAATFYYEEAVRRLDALFRRDGFKTDNLAAPFDVATYKRAWYGLPRGTTGTRVIFYNRRLFDQAGIKPPAASWTWDDFLAAARAVTRPGGQWGTVLEPLTDFYYPWLWGNGADEFERAEAKSSIAETPARDTLQWLADLRLKHNVAPSPGELPDGQAAFATGRAGMWFGPADAELTLAPSVSFDFAIAPQPKGKSGQFAAYQPDVMSLASGSQYIDDAWELMQFLVDVDTQRMELESGLWLPQAKAIAGTEAYQKPSGPPHDRRPAIPGALIKARTPVLLPRGDDMRAVTQKELSPFWLGRRSVKEATEAAAKGVTAILTGEA